MKIIVVLSIGENPKEVVFSSVFMGVENSVVVSSSGLPCPTHSILHLEVGAF